MKRLSTCLTVGAALALSAGLFTTSFALDAPKKPEAAAAAAEKKIPDAAKPGEGHGPRGEGRGFVGANRQIFEFWNDEKVAEKLALKPEQKEKLKAAYAEAKPKMDAAMKKMEEAREKMKEAPKDGAGAPPKMDDAMAAVRKEAQEARKGLQEVVDATLTDEQKATLRDVMREKYGAGMRGERRRGPGGEGHPDGVKKDGGAAAKPDAAKEKAKDEKSAMK
ncbi:Spy/CpxP family protein refolding chaperone [Candidatus Sumerlaeota bacterium]|nr:Spy/CpxP family protein refolding chaperone [Candidatus Sumerlaeota bacterium]